MGTTFDELKTNQDENLRKSRNRDRLMTVLATIARNVFSSWMGFGVQVLSTLLLTPIIIDKVGLEAYGVWLFLGSAVGYYGLIDIGLKAGITQSITRQIANREVAGLRARLSTYNPIMAVVGVSIILVATSAWQVIPHLFKISPNEMRNLTTVVLIQSTGIGFGISMVPYAAILVGLERYDISEGCAVFSKIVSSLMIYIGLSLGGGIVSLAIAYTIGTVIDSSLRFTFARKLLPEIKKVSWSISGKETSALMRNSYLNTVILLSRQVIHFSSSIIVGLMFGAASIPLYSIAGSFVEYATKIIMLSTRVLYPTMVALDKQGNEAQLLQLYKLSTKIAIGASVSILVVGAVWMKRFLTLWFANIEAAEDIINSTPTLFIILGASTVAIAAQRCGSQLLLAKDEVSVLAKLMALEAIATLLFSIGLGYFAGLKGLAVGTLIPCVMFSFLVYIPKHADFLNTNVVSLLSSVLTRPLIFGTAYLIVLKFFEVSLQEFGNWTSFYLKAGGFSLLSFVILSPMLLTNLERASLYRFITSAFKSVLASKRWNRLPRK